MTAAPPSVTRPSSAPLLAALIGFLLCGGALVAIVRPAGQAWAVATFTTETLTLVLGFLVLGVAGTLITTIWRVMLLVAHERAETIRALPGITPAFRDAAIAKHVLPGMSPAMVREALGTPDERAVTQTADGTEIEWRYGVRVHYPGYDRVVTFRGDVVIRVTTR